MNLFLTQFLFFCLRKKGEHHETFCIFYKHESFNRYSDPVGRMPSKWSFTVFYGRRCGDMVNHCSRLLPVQTDKGSETSNRSSAPDLMESIPAEAPADIWAGGTCCRRNRKAGRSSRWNQSNRSDTGRTEYNAVPHRAPDHREITVCLFGSNLAMAGYTRIESYFKRPDRAGKNRWYWKQHPCGHLLWPLCTGEYQNADCGGFCSETCSS